MPRCEPASVVAIPIAVLAVLFVPGSIWATLIAGLYVTGKEQVAELRVTTRHKLTPAEERGTE